MPVLFGSRPSHVGGEGRGREASASCTDYRRWLDVSRGEVHEFFRDRAGMPEHGSGRKPLIGRVP
jgi:hypothetical protein